MRNDQHIPSRDLTSGKLLAGNTVWNLAGQGIPLIAAVFAIPLIIKGLGIERFGILTLAWIIIGYLSLFDFGIGRALTKVLAEKSVEENTEDVLAIVWTSLILLLMLGIASAVILVLLTPWLVHGALKIPTGLRQETAHSFYLLAMAIPIVINTAGIRGVLEAYQRFRISNIVRVPLGLFMFLGPLMVLPFSKSMFWVVAVLVLARIGAWIAYFVFCLRILPELKETVRLNGKHIWVLFGLGGWMTVTNLVSPLMVYLDRFMIGAFVSVAAVAYYTTPFEFVTKLTILPLALTGVLFPAFASSFEQNRDRTALIFNRGMKYVFLSLFPFVLLIVTLSHEALSLWLGADFSQNSSPVLQWLAIGVFFNSLAQIPFALVQGVGRPDLTAKLHIIELLFYLPVLFLLVKSYGIEGAAVAWVLRMAIDMLFLFLLAQRFLPEDKPYLRNGIFAMIAAMITLIIAVQPENIVIKGIFLILSLFFFMLLTWRYLLDNADKQNIFAIFNSSTSSV
jgi:O-antigen/teichoic acid export membrane protein